MKKIFIALILFSIKVNSYCQDGAIPPTLVNKPLLTIGDPAPSLRVKEWLKGKPVTKFKKGKVYVLEFWATWCVPCRAAMPHLSEIARKYRAEVTVIGIDMSEKKSASVKMIKAFVDSMGNNMDYSVATEYANLTHRDWFDASEERGIPKSFVIDREGKLAWIGHPKDLPEVLAKIVDKSWDINEARTIKNTNRYLSNLDDSLNYDLRGYQGDELNNDYIGRPDLALAMIEENISKEPRLKYAPHIAYHTFSSLIKTNAQLAYEYGKIAMVTPTYEEAAYDVIIGVITFYASKVDLPARIYLLGAEANQIMIDNVPYPEIYNMHRYYRQMAEWYWIAGDKPKAINAQEKAVDACKKITSFSALEMKIYEDCLEQYKKQ